MIAAATSRGITSTTQPASDASTGRDSSRATASRMRRWCEVPTRQRYTRCLLAGAQYRASERVGEK
jgi:hypothetical protein